MDTTWGIADLLARHRGIIAVVGSGGKSTLLTSGGRALSAQGARVVLATSTHMLPPSNMSLLDGVERLDAVLARDGIAAVGALDATTGKVAEPPCGIDALAAHADYVLVEADGSRCLPLKAHATWEPVIPARASLAVLVVGASGFERPIARTVHRPEVFCALTGAKLEAPATPELDARAIAAEGLVDANGLVIVNQADDDRAARQARSFAAELRRSCPASIYAGSLRTDRLQRI